MPATRAQGQEKGRALALLSGSGAGSFWRPLGWLRLVGAWLRGLVFGGGPTMRCLKCTHQRTTLIGMQWNLEDEELAWRDVLWIVKATRRGQMDRGEMSSHEGMNQGKGIDNTAKGVYMITGHGMVEHGGTIMDKFMYQAAVGRDGERENWSWSYAGSWDGGREDRRPGEHLPGPDQGQARMGSIHNELKTPVSPLAAVFDRQGSPFRGGVVGGGRASPERRRPLGRGR